MTRLALALLGIASIAGSSISCSSDHTPPPGTTPDAGVPFVADSPQTYVAKVKMLLVGLPPTDAEVAAVVADPTALNGLVATWMALPQYQQKMQVFFELAFQQTQITDADFVNQVPPIGLGRGTAIPTLVQNITESFARTVISQNAAGQPLTNAFTTKQLMMTTALIELYAFLDTRTVDDSGNVADSWFAANPKLQMTVENSGGPIALADTLNAAGSNYLHFYDPDLPNLTYNDTTCNAQDPLVSPATALNLHYMLYGAVPAHKGPVDGCPTHGGSLAGVQMAPSDFTDWRLVTIRQPVGSEAVTKFFDLPTLRTANELVIKTPHPGFFSTPAFQANWPTNTSNTMRVTVNQTLIVATGASIDGTDETKPTTTPGLDAEHAAPGTSCFGCHQLLDPTRSILSATYSWNYSPQTDASLIAQPGLFAFEGVIKPMATIDDFANILASHPLVASGWAEKLCYYVNSAPCDPSDPLFMQMVSDFQANFAWDKLVAALVASPITTNTVQTKTWDTNGEVIAVSRRDHLCAALDNRLSLVDICGLDTALGEKKNGVTTVIQQVVGGLPSDGYGRGAIIPVLPNQPTMFYRAGLETICGQVSQIVIDPTPGQAQAGSKLWSGAMPTPAIADFVSIIMGLPDSDPRAAPALAALTSHFQMASATSGISPTDALRSTFTAACLSPSFIGIGL